MRHSRPGREAFSKGVDESIIQGRYRVIRTLGQGGLGSVFLCQDLRLTGKQWAVKRMNPPSPHLAERFRASFQREAAVLSRLLHPNLPLLVDYFEEEGNAYLVMEFVDGHDLAHEVRQNGPLSEGEAFRHGRLLLELLSWLHHHEPPIIFRDLKPENLICDREGVLKLIDFGMAWRLGSDRRAETVRSGSVGYAAPELWDETAQPDQRSDVYSWGATLVFLLTGRIPTPQNPGAALTGASATVSPEAQAILSRCLQPRPADRYASADAVLEDVNPHLPTLPDGPRPGLDELRPEEGDRPISPRRVAVPTPGSGASPHPKKTPPRRRRAHAIPPALRTLAMPLLLLIAATLAFVSTAWVSMGTAAHGPSSSPSVAGSASPDLGVSPLRARDRASQNKERGRGLYQQGKWAEAIAALDIATTQSPDDSEAWILKQNAYVRLTGAPFFEVPFLGPATGEDRAEYMPHLDGLCLAQEQVNAATDTGAHKVIVTLLDDESSTTRCLHLAEQLVKEKGIRVVLGPTGSQRVLALAPIFNGAHVNLVSPTASSEQIWAAGPYVFTASDPRALRVGALAQYLVAGGHSRMAVIYDQTSRLSGEMARTFEEVVKAHGGTVVSLPPFDDSTTAFDRQIEVIEREKPDMVFFADYRVTPLAHFAAQLRQRNLATPLCSQTVPFARELVSQGGQAVEGLLLTDFFHPQVRTPAARAFLEAFRSKFDDLTPTYQAANSYDTLMAVMAGLAATKTREQLNEYFRSTGVARPAFDGVGGRFALGRRMDARRILLIQVSQGRFKLLKELPPARHSSRGPAGRG